LIYHRILSVVTRGPCSKLLASIARVLGSTQPTTLSGMGYLMKALSGRWYVCWLYRGSNCSLVRQWMAV